MEVIQVSNRCITYRVITGGSWGHDGLELPHQRGGEAVALIT